MFFGFGSNEKPKAVKAERAWSEDNIGTLTFEQAKELLSNAEFVRVAAKVIAGESVETNGFDEMSGSEIAELARMIVADEADVLRDAIGGGMTQEHLWAVIDVGYPDAAEADKMKKDLEIFFEENP